MTEVIFVSTKRNSSIGYYELQCFVGGVWITTNESKLNVLDILFGSAKILKIYKGINFKKDYYKHN